MQAKLDAVVFIVNISHATFINILMQEVHGYNFSEELHTLFHF